MQRRHMLGAMAALPAFSFGESARAQQQAGAIVPASYGSFEDWVAAARDASLRFLSTPTGRRPDYLIRFLALWSAALPRDPEQWQTPWVELSGANTRLEFNTLAAGRPFVVSAFRMAPGCLLPAHCHPGGGGVTLCLQGALTIEHFDLEPGSAVFRETGGPASVRYDSVAHLTPERYTAFTPSTANLHQLRAGPEGALGLDLVVQWEGAGEFSFLKLGDGQELQHAEVGNILAGVWTGMNIVDAYV